MVINKTYEKIKSIGDSRMATTWFVENQKLIKHERLESGNVVNQHE